MNTQTELNMKQKEYIKRLLENGQDNLHICPDCYAAGRRKHLCKNMVFNRSAQALVCCYLGLYRNQYLCKGAQDV